METALLFLYGLPSPLLKDGVGDFLTALADAFLQKSKAHKIRLATSIPRTCTVEQ